MLLVVFGEKPLVSDFHIDETQLEKHGHPNLNFYNVNTPEELTKAVEIAKASKIVG
ncbi:MAG: hypothetical protein ACYCX4_16105 [Bacillota bacterium]